MKAQPAGQVARFSTCVKIKEQEVAMMLANR
jgi:hypothetical protein